MNRRELLAALAALPFAPNALARQDKKDKRDFSLSIESCLSDLIRERVRDERLRELIQPSTTFYHSHERMPPDQAAKVVTYMAGRYDAPIAREIEFDAFGWNLGRTGPLDLRLTVRAKKDESRPPFYVGYYDNRDLNVASYLHKLNPHMSGFKLVVKNGDITGPVLLDAGITFVKFTRCRLRNVCLYDFTLHRHVNVV